jgi:hypothetical protein
MKKAKKPGRMIRIPKTPKESKGHKIYTRWPKMEGGSLPIADEILKIFKKKGGIGGVARRKKLTASNLYEKIYRCDKAIMRVRRLLWLVDCDLKYEIVGRKNHTKK